MDWRRYPNFSEKEMQCQHCRDLEKMNCQVTEHLMEALQTLRRQCGPLVVTSGYRCPEHPIEAVKKNPGAHSAGKAVDVHCDSSSKRYFIISEAMAVESTRANGKVGFVGVGISKDFVHLDVGHPSVSRPALWTY